MQYARDCSFVALIRTRIGDKREKFISELFFVGQETEDIGHGINLSSQYWMGTISSYYFATGDFFRLNDQVIITIPTTGSRCQVWEIKGSPSLVGKLSKNGGGREQRVCPSLDLVRKPIKSRRTNHAKPAYHRRDW
jgi:hypothetical protein